MTKQTNNEHVRVAAYYLWQKAGCPSGRDLEFWNQAFNELYGHQSFNKSNSCKSLSKTSTSKMSTKKVTMKPVSKKTSSAKPVLATKPFYGIKK